MADKDTTQKQGGKNSGSQKKSNITEHRVKQGRIIKRNIKDINSIIDTHPSPDKKPDKK